MEKYSISGQVSVKSKDPQITRAKKSSKTRDDVIASDWCFILNLNTKRKKVGEIFGRMKVNVYFCRRKVNLTAK